MAFRLTTRLLGARLMPLAPTTTRASPCRHALSRRHFAASAPRAATFTDLAVAAPTAVLDGVHALGIPWWAAIPLTAALVQGTLVYHLSARPARKRQIVRTHLFPLVEVKSHGLLQKAMGGRIRDHPEFMLTWSMTMGRIFYRITEAHRLGKVFNAPLFTWTGPLNFLTLLAFAEAIRVKCGLREGLLAIILGGLDGLRPTSHVATKQQEANEQLAQRLESRQERVNSAQTASMNDHVMAGDNVMAELLDGSPPAEPLTQEYVVSPQLPEPLVAPKAYAEYADPTMSFEGTAWFSDLTLPDPHYCLPLALGATFLLGVKWTDGVRDVGKKSSIDQRPQARDNRITEASETIVKAPEKAALKTAAETATLDQQRKVTSETNAAFAAADKLRQDLAHREPVRESALAKLAFGDKLTIVMAVFLTLITIKMPAGILIYIMANKMARRLSKWWLDMRYPIPQLIRPCRRPMRIRARKSFRNV